jgi:hypothetical protein
MQEIKIISANVAGAEFRKCGPNAGDTAVAEDSTAVVGEGPGEVTEADTSGASSGEAVAAAACHQASPASSSLLEPTKM